LILVSLAFGDCDGDREDGQNCEELLHRRHVGGASLAQNERLCRRELIGLGKGVFFGLYNI
jgi:hypothetical protein